MKKTKIFYWIFTILFALLMVATAIPNIIASPSDVDGFRQMGLPAYLPPFLGVAKILGILAILIPGYPRIKEWAYAGLVFDLIGATYCIISTQPGVAWLFMALPLLLATGSYVFYHKILSQSGNKEAVLQGKQDPDNRIQAAGFE